MLADAYFQLQGRFERTAADDGGLVSMDALVSDTTLQAIANRDLSFRRFHRAYGWDFLLERDLRGVIDSRGWQRGPTATLLAPRGEKLNSTFVGRFEGGIRAYTYRFLPRSALLGPHALTVTDPRLPLNWDEENGSDSPLEASASELAPAALARLATLVEARLREMKVSDWLAFAEVLEADGSHGWLTLTNDVKLKLSLDDPLVPAWCGALVRLAAASDQADFELKLQTARALPNWKSEYEGWLLMSSTEGRRAMLGDRLAAAVMDRELSWAAFDMPGDPEWRLDRDAWGPLSRLIDEARSFLFIGSFVIEDVEAAKRIARKAYELPGRVWVMCDLKEAFQDHLESILIGDFDPNERGFTLHRRKWECLRILLDSPAQVRWVNSHLKAYMSEREALFGSANLAPRSLRGNLESFFRFQDEPTLQALFGTLKQIWRTHAEARVLKPLTGVGLVCSTLMPADRTDAASRPASGHGPFIGTAAYAERVRRDLKEARRSVHALVYALSPQSSLLRGGNRNLDRQIGADVRRVGDGLRGVVPVRGCHAKLVVIDRRIVYVGGINDPGGDMSDLMARFESSRLGRDIALAIEGTLRLG